LYVMAGKPSDFGGGKRVFMQIIKNINKNHYNIFSCCSFPKNREEELHKLGVTIRRVDMSRKMNLNSILSLMRIMRNDNIHIVHSQGALADLFSRISSALAGVPFVITSVAMLVERYDVSKLKKMIYIGIDRLFEKTVDKFIVVSDALNRALIERHNISHHKVVKVYNGIEIDEYKPDLKEIKNKKLEVRRELGIKNDMPVIGAIGRLVWQKGFEYLIEAVPEVLKKYPDARFLIVGEGPLKDKLKLISERTNAADRIVFTGFRSDVKEILASIDVLAMPSLLEGLPIVLLEAMAMAKPIVATKIEGISEVLVSDKTGLLVPAKNPIALAGAITEILNDKTKAILLGQNARKMAEEYFSVKKMVEQTELVYEKLLNEKNNADIINSE